MDYNTTDCSSIDGCMICGTYYSSFVPYIQCLECNVGHGYNNVTGTCNSDCPYADQSLNETSGECYCTDGSYLNPWGFCCADT